ncbi:MAG: hypothetical protein CVV56_05995 [Tenericutes bacterium HGW-Tenericutes-1]|nr:MAG: hypothetical protein CVV56_05995 [Tenericutes bacterium HGW-Tenericutes-1]
MKELLKKSWFTGLITIGLLLLVFFLNLWILSLKLNWPYSESFWELAKDLSSGDFINIIAFIFTLLFYISILPILISGISIIKKNNKGFVISMIYFIVFETLLIVFQSISTYLSVFAIVLIILNVVFTLGAFVMLILRGKNMDHTIDPKKEAKEVLLKNTKIPLAVLIVDLIAVIILVSTFVFPVYSAVISNTIYHSVLASVLFLGETRIEVVIYFLVNFALFLGMVLYFAQCISYYFYDKESFIKKSKTLISYIFIVTLVFFLSGLGMVIYHTLIGNIAQTIAYIPMLLNSVVIFVFSVLMGKFHAINHSVINTAKVRFARIESLFYVIVITAITGLMLLLKIIKIDIVSGSYTDTVELTGIAILRDYASLDPGYRIIAFVLVVMLIASGIFLLAAISSYLAKYRKFDNIVKSATMINIFFIFIISISGYYFQIGQQIDKAIILDIFSFYGIPVPGSINDYEYLIRSDAIYALIASVAVLVIMFLRKAFDHEEMNIFEPALLPASDGKIEDTSSKLSSDTDDESFSTFDPCPAFSELDKKVDGFGKDLEKRKSQKTKDKTLHELVHFVVEYAKNSRLHLSYTEEDIATFVAGLGASKLSILQGMSGTGKTSLPKIFAEAILANCDIIEVESSWKDKNELLGYYNEFSMKYTPKKFTLALYKAALNQDIFTFILLDEMNLSRIEYYFSDFLSLMENEEHQRELKLINIKLARKEEGNEIEYLALNEGHTLRIPPNVWFIGTANRDESTFVISDKVYDRAQTMNFTKRAPKVRNYSTPISQQYYDYQTMNNLFVEAKKNGNFDAENSELIKSVEALLAPFNISFGNRILKQIEDFVNIYNACFDSKDVESEAIEKILLSKVVAKLEVKTIDDKEKLEMEFEKLNLRQCVAFIKRLDNE